MPVDDDKDGALAREAVKGHLANFRMPDFITEFKFRDDALPYDPSFTSASFSPYNYLDEMPKDVAVYAISGWMDGAGYANGTLSRFLTLPNAQRRVMLGPWDHGARVNASPWRARVEPELPVLGEVLRFFDEHLAGRRHGAPRRGPDPLFHRACRGMALGQELAAGERQPAVLHRARPPARRGAAERRHVGAVPGRLHGWAAGPRRATSASPASTRCRITPTGPSAKRKLPGFTTQPLDKPLEIAGHPVVSLWLSSSEPDAAVFVYLSEVEADGTSRYVTEGVLRAIHRAEAPAPRNYRTTWPWRSFARKDAAADAGRRAAAPALRPAADGVALRGGQPPQALDRRRRRRPFRADAARPAAAPHVAERRRTRERARPADE